MAFVAPFRAVRFNNEKIEKMEEVVSPPYDVIDSAAEKALSSRNKYNMIQLDLVKHAGQETNDDRYTEVKKTFNSWLADDVLLQEDSPAIYLYYIDYLLPNGNKLRRKGLTAMVRLHEFAEGIVKPHEKTFKGVTDDRLKLIDTCQAQLSQIFSLYPDQKGEVMAELEGACQDEPLYQVEDQDGCLHTIYRVDQPSALSKVSELFKSRSLYIADGHHRYTTSLRLRQAMIDREGQVADDSPYNHIMMYLCPMEDEGLSVLPTHRLLRYPSVIDAPFLVEKLRPAFSITEIDNGTREEQVAELLTDMVDKADGKTMLGMYLPDSDRCFLLGLKDGVMDEKFGVKMPNSLKMLDVTVLSDLIIENLFSLCHDKCNDENLVSYFSDIDTALDVAVKESLAVKDETTILFFMNNTTVDQVKTVADEDLFMPHKSTYFYPKILTGLLINKIDSATKY